MTTTFAPTTFAADVATSGRAVAHVPASVMAPASWCAMAVVPAAAVAPASAAVAMAPATSKRTEKRTTAAAVRITRSLAAPPGQ